MKGLVGVLLLVALICLVNGQRGARRRDRRRGDTDVSVSVRTDSDRRRGRRRGGFDRGLLDGALSLNTGRGGVFLDFGGFGRDRFFDRGFGRGGRGRFFGRRFGRGRRDVCRGSYRRGCFGGSFFFGGSRQCFRDFDCPRGRFCCPDSCGSRSCY